MSYYRRDLSQMFGGPLTPAVKTLILANIVAEILRRLIANFSDWFALVPANVLPWSFQLWRVGTYMFVHADFGHLFFNMLGLFFFGCSIERTWGTRSFYRYYFLCGLGGALFAFASVPLWNVPIVGASGAIYGILLAFGVLFPRQQVLVFFAFPVEARFLVAFYGIMAFVSSLSGSQGVAHVVHLGGFVTGYALLRWVGVARGRRSVGGGEFMGSFKDAYRRWRMRRLRRKFESYYEKRSGGDGPGAIH